MGGGPAVAKWQAAIGGSLFLTGLVILAADCPAVNKPWILLVYGLITMLTYVWPMLAGIDRIRADRKGTQCNNLIQSLTHLASMDGAYTWWFASEIIKNFSDSKDTVGCEQGWDQLCLILLSIRFVFLAFYVLFWLSALVYYGCIKKT